jgi:hypothetical protein
MVEDRATHRDGRGKRSIDFLLWVVLDPNRLLLAFWIAAVIFWLVSEILLVDPATVEGQKD